MGKKKKKRKNKNKAQGYTLEHDGTIIRKGKSNNKNKRAWADKVKSPKDSQKTESSISKPLEWGKGYSLQDTGTSAQTVESLNDTSQDTCTAAQSKAIDRYQSICKPVKKPKGNLQRRERMLAVVEDAESLKLAQTTEYYDEISNKTFKSKTAMNEYRLKHFGIPNASSSICAYPLEPGRHDENNERLQFSEVSANTKEAIAALVRLQTVPKKKKRLVKTAEMILDEARGEEDQEVDNKNDSPEPVMISKKKPYENELHIAAGGASEAARFRMEGARKKKGKGVLTNESRARELLYGDVLKQDEQRVFKATDGSEFNSATSRDKYEEELEDQSIFLSPLEKISEHFVFFVNWSNPDVVAGTTKTMLKMIDKLLQAKTVEDREKFGRLRLNNKAIIKRFVKVPYALALLRAIGFVKATSAGEEVLTFQYSDMNRKSVEFLKQCILDCQAEMVEE